MSQRRAARRGVVAFLAIAGAAYFLCWCLGEKPLLSLGGGFYLHEFESGSYYIRKGRFDFTPGGVLDGVVRALDSADGQVVVEIERLYGGDPSGWYVLDTESGKMTGPMPLSEIRTKLVRKPLDPVPPRVYWERHAWW